MDQRPQEGDRATLLARAQRMLHHRGGADLEAAGANTASQLTWKGHWHFKKKRRETCGFCERPFHGKLLLPLGG